MSLMDSILEPFDDQYQVRIFPVGSLAELDSVGDADDIGVKTVCTCVCLL